MKIMYKIKEVKFQNIFSNLVKHIAIIKYETLRQYVGHYKQIFDIERLCKSIEKITCKIIQEVKK